MVNQIRSEPKRYLDEGTRLIESNGKNLLRLINQLLDLSKLENKSFHLHLQQADIVPYLRYVTESFQTYANSRNLSLRFFSSQASLLMDFDEEQIKQVLTNLISNALKLTLSGVEERVKLEIVKSANEDVPVSRLLIFVSGNGIGIAEKDLPHVFDRFYQVDGSHTREGEGTGIGLAHTQELVKIMGGEISVQSEVGKGSTFLISLPVTTNARISDRVIPGHTVTTPERTSGEPTSKSRSYCLPPKPMQPPKSPASVAGPMHISPSLLTRKNWSCGWNCWWSAKSGWWPIFPKTCSGLRPPFPAKPKRRK